MTSPTPGACGPRGRLRRPWLLRPLRVGAGAIGVEALAESILAELVVELALVRVAEDVVRVVHRLEARLGLLVSRVLVRVRSFLASLRYAFLMASASAVLATPRTAQ